MAVASAPVARSRREGHSFRAVVIGSAALALVIFAVGFALYRRYIQYERVVALHVPAGAMAAVRLDVEQAVLYEPVRRNLLPLLGSPLESASRGDARLARIEKRTGIERGDLREVMAARFAESDDWVVVLGGIFPRGPAAQDIALAYASEGIPWELSADGRYALGPGGVAVTRASDGVIVIGSSREAAAAALPAREPHLPVVRHGAGGFAVDSRWLTRARPMAARDYPGAAATADNATAVRAEARFAEDERVALSVWVSLSGGPGGKASFQQAKAALKEQWGVRPSDGLRLLLNGLDRAVVSESGGEARVDLAWERKDVDAAMALQADAIRGAFAPGTHP